MQVGVTKLGKKKKTTHADVWWTRVHTVIMRRPLACCAVCVIRYYAISMHSTLSVVWGRFDVKDMGNVQCPIESLMFMQWQPLPWKSSKSVIMNFGVFMVVKFHFLHDLLAYDTV